MSDKPIGVGDLVIVVHQCCLAARHIGKIRTVAHVRMDETICPHCKLICRSLHAESVERRGWHGVPVSWLKRLDPDALKDDVPTGEELTV